MTYSPSVILSIANIRHYYYTALALQREGYLKRFICSVGYVNNSHFKYLPHSLGKLVSPRYYDEIEPSIIKAIPWTELIPRGLKKLNIISSEQTNWIFANGYDWFAQAYIDPCDYFHFVVPTGFSSARKAKRQGSIVIADVRTVYPDYSVNLIKQENELWGFNIEFNDILINKSKDEFELADYLIVPSEFARNTFLQAGFDKSKIFSVPYGVDHLTFSELQSPAIHSQESIFRVLYVGRLSPLKGIHYLIQAFGELNLPDAELLLVGHIEDSYRDQIRKAVTGNERIRAIGSIPHGELQQYYASASVFVLPSLTDSFGMVSLEAMACGIPVIVTENTGSNDAICDGENGFIIPIRDSESIKEKLLWLYYHPEERLEMGKSAYMRSCDYTWDAYGQCIITVYNKITPI